MEKGLKSKVGSNKLNESASSPLKKVEGALDVNEIIKDDAKLIEVHFISECMVKHLTNKEIQAEYEKEFGKEITYNMITRLKNLTRAVYLAEISHNKDELVAEELMHANWELKELQEYWQKSKRPKKKKVHHVADSDGTELTTYQLDEITETEEEQIGDLDAMKRIAAVRERVIGILGLKAPKEADDKGNKGTSGITINIVGQKKDVKVEEAQIVE